MVGEQLRVGINLLFLLPEMEGTARNALSLLDELARLDSPIEYVVFVNRDTPRDRLPSAPNFSVVPLPISARSRWRRYLYEQVALPIVALRHRVSVMHSMNYVAPMLLGRRNIVSIHDLNFLQPCVEMTPLRRFALRVFVALAAKTSGKIATLSSFSGAEIERRYNLDPQKTAVVPCAVSDCAGEAGDDDAAVLRALGVRERFVLGIGVNKAYKDVHSLLRGYARSDTRQSHQLVLVGRHSGPYDELLELAQALGVADTTQFTGAVEDRVLAALYRRASVFVFTSLYEGFGMPPIEAMHYGAPVICSSYGAAREVVGDAALFVPPKDDVAIAEAIDRLTSDSALRSQLTERGAARAQTFTWENSARKLVELYQATGKIPAPLEIHYER